MEDAAIQSFEQQQASGRADEMVRQREAALNAQFASKNTEAANGTYLEDSEGNSTGIKYDANLGGIYDEHDAIAFGRAVEDLGSKDKFGGDVDKAIKGFEAATGKLPSADDLNRIMYGDRSKNYIPYASEQDSEDAGKRAFSLGKQKIANSAVGKELAANTATSQAQLDKDLSSLSSQRKLFTSEQIDNNRRRLNDGSIGIQEFSLNKVILEAARKSGGELTQKGVDKLKKVIDPNPTTLKSAEKNEDIKQYNSALEQKAVEFGNAVPDPQEVSVEEYTTPVLPSSGIEDVPNDIESASIYNNKTSALEGVGVGLSFFQKLGAEAPSTYVNRLKEAGGSEELQNRLLKNLQGVTSSLSESDSDEIADLLMSPTENLDPIQKAAKKETPPKAGGKAFDRIVEQSDVYAAGKESMIADYKAARNNDERREILEMFSSGVYNELGGSAEDILAEDADVAARIARYKQNVLSSTS
jgi:hypothetical protein